MPPVPGAGAVTADAAGTTTGPRVLRATGAPRGAVLRGAASVLLAPLALLLAAVRGALRRPSTLVVATIVLVCVPVGGMTVWDVHLTAGDIASAVLVVVSLAAAAGSGRRPLSRGACWSFAAVLVALALSTLTADDPAASLTGLVRYGQLLVLVPVAVLVSLRDRADAVLVCGALAVVAVAEGTLGGWQYLSGTGALYAGENIRAVGTFGALDIMGMSTVVSFGLLVALGFGLAGTGRHRVLLLLVAAALLVPLVLSLSRGSLLAVVCAAVVVLAVHQWRAALLTVLLVAALGVVLVGRFGLGADTAGERVASIGSTIGEPDQSVTDRYDLWTAAAGMWRDHPLTGVGLRNFPEYRDSYAPLRLSSGSDVGEPDGSFSREPLLSPHNMYLLVASEQGTVGLLAVGALLAALAVGTVRRLLRAVTPTQHALGLCSLGLLTWLLVDFGYADIGGASSVLTAVVLGLVAWWALAVPPPSGRRAA